MIKRQIAVVGGGLAGWSAAVGFAKAGFDTILLAPASTSDRRSTALIGPSVDFLAGLGLAEGLREAGQPLVVMRLIDDTGRLLRAPTVEFHASEIDLDAFGQNVMNADLLRMLNEIGETLSDRLTVVEEGLVSIATDADGVTIETATHEIRAGLAVGADGRNSPVRTHAGIGVRKWSYPQSAIVLNFAHDRDHDSISTEFHTRTGPFTQVPLPGRRSSLVWVEEPKVADLLADVSLSRLSRMVEDRMHSILGAVEVEEGVQCFPLSGAAAERMTAERIALVGEAAHVFPPIGAQGLNLGLRDAADLIEVAGRHRDDPGCPAMLRDYEAKRRVDVVSRTAAVDLLNRSLLTEFLPVQAIRSLGLGLLARGSMLRRFVMKEGVTPGSSLRRSPRRTPPDDAPLDPLVP
nr:UbiH/UbiF family hydroxylase [Aureimonas sp. AU12]